MAGSHAHVGLGLGQHRVVRPRVDLEEDVAFLHVIAFGKRRLLQIAGYARKDVGAVHGLGASGEDLEIGHRVGDGAADLDFRLRRFGRLGLAFASQYPDGRHQGAGKGAAPTNKGSLSRAAQMVHGLCVLVWIPTCR